LNSTDLTWVRLGVASGVVTLAAYTAFILVTGPLLLGVVLAAAFGVCLGPASAGVRSLLRAHRRSVLSDIGLAANIAAGVLFVAMAFVQLSVGDALDADRGRALEAAVREVFDRVQLGLDVAWDVFISLGTIAFALDMRRHPRFGLPYSAAGVATGALLLVLNLATFPVPPGNSGLVDVGPLLGAWYAAVTIRIAGSLRWAASMVRE
jgi:hypothetical protein